MIWNFEKFKDRTALVDENDETLSYNQLCQAEKLFTSKLSARGIVLCLCQNTLGSVIGYLNFLNIEIIPLLVDAKTPIESINNLIQKWDPLYLWIPKTLIDRYNYPVILSLHNFKLLKRSTNSNIQLNKELALLLSTSGSTGSTKMIRISYQNIKENSLSIIKSLEIKPEDRAITTLPMQYSYGLSIINTHLISGASIILTEKNPISKAFWQLVKQHKASSIAGVPILYRIYQKLNLADKELKTLKTFTQAGGKLPIEIQEEFASKSKTHNKRFFVMYGQTEATARISILDQEQAPAKIGSIGTPISGGRIVLQDKNGNEVNEAFREGEIIYCGKNVCLGYANNHNDLSRGDDNNGILHTGDIGYRDEDGYYYISGRNSRIIKILGHRVNLDELENMLQSYFHTSDLAILYENDQIYIFMTKDVNRDNLKKHMTEKTLLNPLLFAIKKIQVIPRNQYGKIMYHLLLKQND